MADERLNEIESKLAFHEETLRILNEVVCRQQQQIDQLEEVCRALRARWEELTHRLAGPPAIVNPDLDRPPHY
jgi:SlyX protein